MFSKIVDSLRSTSNASNTNNMNTNMNNNNNNTMDGRYPNVPGINVERRSSFDEEGDSAHPLANESKSIPSYAHNDNGKQTLNTTTTPSTATYIQGNDSGSSAIGIKPGQGGSLGTDPVYVDVRRRSSLFGYSRNAADDYMQKDLLSSSWS